MKREIKISKKKLKYFNSILCFDQPSKEHKENKPIYKKTVKFKEKIKADIILLNSDPPRVEAILYNESYDISFANEWYETLDGEYTWIFNNEQFTLTVKER